MVPSERHHDLVASRTRAVAEDPRWRRHMAVGSVKKTARKGNAAGPVRMIAWNVDWAEPGSLRLPAVLRGGSPS